MNNVLINTQTLLEALLRITCFSSTLLHLLRAGCEFTNQVLKKICQSDIADCLLYAVIEGIHDVFWKSALYEQQREELFHAIPSCK